MNSQGRFILIVAAISFIAAVIAKLAGNSSASGLLGAPAVALSGLVALGHLVTLDDDMPGEWSNFEGDKEIWRASLLELSVKVVVFIVVAAVVYV